MQLLGKTVPFLASSTTVVVAILILLSLQTWSAPEKDVSQSRCISNLRMIAIGLAMYADDNNGRLPPAGAEGLGLVRAYFRGGAQSAFHCPADPVRHDSATNAPLDEDHCSYVYVGGSWGFSNVLVDGTWQTKTVTNPVPICWDKPENHGTNGLNVLFNDTRVKWLTLDEWEKIRPGKQL
jgi:hypothetical protein